MSLDCFDAKIAAGLVDEARGRKLAEWIGAVEDEAARRTGNAEAAYARAAKRASDHAAETAKVAERARRQAVAQMTALNRFAEYEGEVKQLRAEGRAPVGLAGEDRSVAYDAFSSLLAHDTHEIATGPNVHYRARQLRAEAHGEFADAIDRLRPKYAGLKNETVIEYDLLKAIYDEPVGVETARLDAAAWKKVEEGLRGKFVAAGGELPVREDWHIPNPAHDWAKISAGGRDLWKEDVKGWLDRDKMVDFETGGRLDDGRLDAVLDDVFKTLSSRAIEGPPTAEFKGQGPLATRRMHERILHFKDAASWQAYAEKYAGHASPYEAMLSYINRMSEDIAMLEILGPNPESMHRFALSAIKRETGRLSGEAGDKSAKGLKKATKANRVIGAVLGSDEKRFDNLWAEVTGANDVAVNTIWADRMSAGRGLLASAQLGSAMVSSLTDAPVVLMTARFDGLSAWRVGKRFVEMFATTGSEVEAARFGLVLDSLAHGAGQVDRIMGETIRTGRAQKLSGAVMRASALRRWTALWKNAFSLEMMGHVADQRGLAYDALDGRFREALSRHGVDAGAWDLIRNSPLYEPRAKAFFIRPQDVARGGAPEHEAASQALSRLVHTEADYGVIESDPRVRAFLLGQSRPGTEGGEFRRSVAMYKSFPVTLMSRHFNRMVARGWRDGSRLGHAAATFALMTVMGALAMQTKMVINGRDPVSMDPSSDLGRKAWVHAMLQGGGLGIFGDLLFQDQTRYGNSAVATLAGPVAGAIESVLFDFIVANGQRLAKGEETHMAGDALYLAGRYMPGSTLWYSRLAFQREVLDRLALMLDERTPERLRRLEKAAQKNWGQKSWWRAGRSAPDRAPDLSAIAGP